MERQRLNVFRMEMMGATVHAVETGTRTLKDAVDAAFGAWMNDLEAFYVLGSAVGPHPYPTIVHEFQKVISEESRRQILEKEGRFTRLRYCLCRWWFQCYRSFFSVCG